MSSIKLVDVILTIVCPSFGMIAANFMFLAPLNDLQEAVNIGLGLGNLNPTPWAFMTGNCIGWLAYALITTDWYLFWANYPGFLISVWLNLGAVKLMYSFHHREGSRQAVVKYLTSKRLRVDADGNVTDDVNAKIQRSGGWNQDNSEQLLARKSKIKMRRPSLWQAQSLSIVTIADHSKDTKSGDNDWSKIIHDVTSKTVPAKAPHEYLVLGIIVTWTFALFMLGFFGSNSSEKDDGNFVVVISNKKYSLNLFVIALMANANLLVFYGAPLTAIKLVFKTKTSDTLHLPTMIGNTANSIFWTSYALAPQINDIFIYVPNGLGVVLGVVQIVLWALFPSKKKMDARKENKEKKNGNNKDKNSNSNTSDENDDNNNSSNKQNDKDADDVAIEEFIRASAASMTMPTASELGEIGDIEEGNDKGNEMGNDHDNDANSNSNDKYIDYGARGGYDEYVASQNTSIPQPVSQLQQQPTMTTAPNANANTRISWETQQQQQNQYQQHHLQQKQQDMYSSETSFNAIDSDAGGAVRNKVSVASTSIPKHSAMKNHPRYSNMSNNGNVPHLHSYAYHSVPEGASAAGGNTPSKRGSSSSMTVMQDGSIQQQQRQRSITANNNKWDNANKGNNYNNNTIINNTVAAPPPVVMEQKQQQFVTSTPTTSTSTSTYLSMLTGLDGDGDVDDVSSSNIASVSFGSDQERGSASQQQQSDTHTPAAVYSTRQMEHSVPVVTAIDPTTSIVSATSSSLSSSSIQEHSQIDISDSTTPRTTATPSTLLATARTPPAVSEDAIAAKKRIKEISLQRQIVESSFNDKQEQLRRQKEQYDKKLKEIEDSKKKHDEHLVMLRASIEAKLLKKKERAEARKHKQKEAREAKIRKEEKQVGLITAEADRVQKELLLLKKQTEELDSRQAVYEAEAAELQAGFDSDEDDDSEELSSIETFTENHDSVLSGDINTRPSGGSVYHEKKKQLQVKLDSKK